MNPLDRITEAAKQFDRKGATLAADEFAAAIRALGDRYTSAQAKTAVRRLRGVRYWAPAMVIADAVFESGERDPELRVLYAQSLIDAGRLEAALPIVEEVLASVPRDTETYAEARGALGRIHKQRYVNGGGAPELRQQYFDRAFEAYYDFYRDTGNSWHGINAAALVELARRHELECRTVQPFAATLFDEMRARVAAGTGDAWTYATAGEAAVATGQWAEAKEWYARFAAHPQISAFALGSALRQLQEVWGLTDDRDPGASLIPLLRVETLRRSGGEVELAAGDVKREVQRIDDSHLQATFGNESAVPFGWYRKGLECCFSVCRIEDDYDRPAGTGFVVRGGDFRPGLGDRRCILTNDHVVSEHDPKALPPEKAYARFHALDGAPRVTIDEVLWRSGRAELDAALLSVVDDKLPDVATYPMATRPLDRAKEQKIFVIGHPQGGALSISLYDNVLLDCNDTFVHYRSPTLPGSSGSPVFNNDWELVALHHAGHQQTRKLDGSGTYEANEGIQIGKICATAKG